MRQTWKAWVAFAAANGLIAVAAGAYAAHWLDAADPVLANAFTTGVDYQMWHALALLGVAWLAERAEGGRGNPRLARLAGLAFVLGIALFSGTLYVFGLSGAVWMSGAAPAGGALLMAGWILLALSPIGGPGRE
ncbi:MAG: DUF423 domain-containing protein [Alphaproteobacteria bacterium]|nr:DUF423 domain-containing protein [Alphaproteobacteria bacterium]MBM3731934.1 DUF423 domain-containing protein [Acidimicrobiia bacterium]